MTTAKWTTSWSLLGPGVELGPSAPNIMKGINIFNETNVVKDFSYNYDRIIQVLWKKGNKKKINLLVWKCLRWCHMTTLSNFRLRFEPSGLPTSTNEYNESKQQHHLHYPAARVNEKMDVFRVSGVDALRHGGNPKYFDGHNWNNQPTRAVGQHRPTILPTCELQIFY
jgi:hypothetical protein